MGRTRGMPVTNEYVEGNEDVYILVQDREDGLVSLGIFAVSNDARLCGIVLPPETARATAEKLTLASWKSEDRGRWQREQRDDR